MNRLTRTCFTAAVIVWLQGCLAVSQADVFLWELSNVSTDWSNVLNWAGTPNQVPDDNTDEAIVTVPSTQGSPTLNSGNVTIGQLTIASNGDVNTGNGTNNFALTVQSSLTQDGSTLIDGSGSSLTVWQSPVLNDFDTDSLELVDNATLILRQGARVQIDGLLELEESTIFGDGTVELNGDVNFSNNGTLRATNGGTLTIGRTGTERIDMDGSSENGMLRADANSTLIIDLPNTGALFDGTISIQQDGEIRINDNWQLASTAGTQLDFHGGSGAATLSGTSATFDNIVNIQSGTAVIDVPTTVLAGADVNIGDGTTLQINRPTTFVHPGSYDNEYDTNLIVNADLDIGTGSGNFNWDGESLNQVLSGITIVNEDASLNIDVDRVDQAGLAERVSMNLRINSGHVDVRNTANQWELDSSLRMNNTNGTVPTLSGAEIILSRTVTVLGDGASRINASTQLTSDSDVTVFSGATLDFRGSTTLLDGGTFAGQGEVDLNSDTTTVTDATIVNMPQGVFDLDGLGIASDQLIIAQPLTLNVASLDLDDANGIDHHTIIGATGQLNVSFSNPTNGYRFDQQLDLIGTAPAAPFSVHLTGADVELAGTTTTFGRSGSESRIDFTGNTTVSANSQFFLDAGTNATPNVIHAPANVQGAGQLIVLLGSHLRMNDGAHAGLEIVNRGTFYVGSDTAFASVNGFTQAFGTLELGIDGTTPGTSFDQLDVDQVADLNGTLRIQVNQSGGTYNDPDTAGMVDEFLLIAATVTQGSFDTFVYDGQSLVADFVTLGQQRHHIDDGLFRILNYDDDGVSLLNYRALAGDANGDGTVNGSDFIIWNANKFTSGTDWLTGDFNGDGNTDGQDFILWNANKFATAFDAVAVPEPKLAVCLLLCVMLFPRSRNRLTERP